MTEQPPTPANSTGEPPIPTVEETTLQVGEARLRLHAQLPPNVRLQVHVQALTDDDQPLDEQSITLGDGRFTPPLTWRSRLAGWLSQPVNLAAVLFWASLLIYLLTRLIGLERYPIFFFTDEAIQTLLAQDFLRDGFRGYDGFLFPTYFFNSYQYNLGVSVYWQVIPTLLFGRSIFVTRAACVLATLLGAAYVGLTLRDAFNIRHYWLGVLILGITPAWFLHSRTAFETALAVSFYAGFLYYYLLYRSGKTKALYASAGMAALSFYSYSPARMVVLVTALFLLLSDFNYHKQHRDVVLRTMGLCLLLAVPILRFQIHHPEENVQHLRQLGSYWIENRPLQEKLARYGREYLRGLNPGYWFVPNAVDMSRHKMDGLGNLLRPTLPLLLLGMLVCLKNLRSSPHRALLLAVAAAPSGAALVALGITRALNMVIPAALLTALGAVALLDWLQNRWQKAWPGLVLGTFILLAGGHAWLLRTALVDGPLWDTDYGLNGMQYGARQVFSAIDNILKYDPQTRIVLSPTWANGTDIVARFFFEPTPFELGSIDGYLLEHKDVSDDTLFIMTPDEYQKTLETNKFTDVRVEKTLPAPNGQPAFYFIRLRYVDNIDALLEEERAARRILQETSVYLGSTPVTVRHSYLDMGEAALLFDGNNDSLIRTLEANPLRLEIVLPDERFISSVILRIGGTHTTAHLELFDAQGKQLQILQRVALEEPQPHDLKFVLNKPVKVKELKIDVSNTYDLEPAHVHLWEVTLK